MYQDVVLVNYPPEASGPEVKIIKARPLGRAVPWCDYTQPGSGGVILLFEGEDGFYYVQEINTFSNPFRTFYHLSRFHSLSDAILCGIANGVGRDGLDKVFLSLL